MSQIPEMRREFIHGKKFDDQWKSLNLNDDDLKDLQMIPNKKNELPFDSSSVKYWYEY